MSTDNLLPTKVRYYSGFFYTPNLTFRDTIVIIVLQTLKITIYERNYE